MTPDPYASIPDPDPLTQSVLVDYQWGDTTFEILCTACTVRTLLCLDSGCDIEWLHCKAVQRHDVEKGGLLSATTCLIPCQYVTRIRPGPTYNVVEKKTTEDVALFPANQRAPSSAIPIFEIHRALTACRGLRVAEPDKGYMYNDFISKVSKRFADEISNIEANHNFENGPEFEVAICNVLGEILPQKYGICRGYVVNARGDMQGDDIIVFDRMRFPTIRGLEKNYSRKEQVPIEAVYAYLEAKHTLNINGDDDSSFARAVHQVSRVKLLCIQRQPVSLGNLAPYVELDLGKHVQPLPGWPTTRNPIYGAVIARQVREKKGGAILTDSTQIQEHLQSVTLKCEIHPDIVVAGRHNLVVPTLCDDGSDEAHIPSPFFLHGRSHMNTVAMDDVAFGAALGFLLWALDWIQLGEMPWPDILRNCMWPKES